MFYDRPDPVISKIMLFEPPIAIHHDPHFFTFTQLSHHAVIDALDVFQILFLEVFIDLFQKTYLMLQVCCFIIYGEVGYPDTFFIGYLRMIDPMFVQTTDLPPIHFSTVVCFSVQHIWIQFTYQRSVFIDIAPSSFKEYT